MNKTLLSIAVLALITGCSGDKDHDNKGAHKDDGHSHAVHWSYEGEGSPEKWGTLKPDYATCATGKSQSPIDIKGAQSGGLMPIEFHYQAATNPEVVNNGHTIQVNYPTGSYAVMGGKKYDLLQFHFHSPSEHTISGAHADMVAHLVHKAADGQLGVVGVLFNKSGENSVLAPIWSSMPSAEGKATVMASIDVNQLLPAERSYYNYSGSLTTPPCSENVNWNVMKTAVKSSPAQIAAFNSLFSKSIRPVQPLNSRTISQL